MGLRWLPSRIWGCQSYNHKELNSANNLSKQCSLESSERNTALSISQFQPIKDCQISELYNCKIIHLCYLKPLSLCSFLMAGIQYTPWITSVTAITCAWGCALCFVRIISNSNQCYKMELPHFRGEVKRLAQGHIPSTWQSWDWILG